ncbi:MAG: c-type cytochrome [Chloroflexi bacterium]|nr:c-type cytochrome [Chloroflexota bacterium]
MLQFGRMLVDRIENRILVGIIAFVGIMVLVGWVAINENARMASFTRQYNARSIERGAELFAANCSTCHGTDGRGVSLRAPALNSPHLFGYDFLAQWDDEIDTLNREIAALESEKLALQDELAADGVTDRRREAIETRIAEIDAELADPERQARIEELQFERQQQVTAMVAAVDKGYDPDVPSRLVQLGWGGTRESFIQTTLIHGRPTSISYWRAPMVSWGQRSGGPLRDDQIQDIVNYILNWDKGTDWTLEDLLAVQQFPIIPGEGGGGEITAEAVGSDVDAALAALTTVVGDPVRGQALYEGSERTQRAQRLGCSGCHYGGVQGPAYDGLWERILDERLTDPALAGYTPEHYVIESILAPGAYVVSGWAAGQMPAQFGQQMSAQDVADILEFIKASDPNYVAPEQPAEEPAAEGEGDGG